MTSTQGPGAVICSTDSTTPNSTAFRWWRLSVSRRQRAGSGYMQEIDLLTLVKDVAAQFAQLVSSPEQLPMVLDRAFRAALTNGSPVW